MWNAFFLLQCKGKKNIAKGKTETKQKWLFFRKESSSCVRPKDIQEI